MAEIPATDRTRVRRLPERGSHDRDLIYSVLDEALICHVGFTVDDQPYVIPTIHARDGDRLYLHGSPASRMLRTTGRGIPVCVTATLVDGLVLARSTFHHSMNYRSVVVLGTATTVTDSAEKRHALDVLVDRVAPGRSAEARGPNEKELKATLVLAVPLDEASAKVRTGWPVDDDEDLDLGVWAGVLPVALNFGEPQQDPQSDHPTPGYLEEYRRP